MALSPQFSPRFDRYLSLAAGWVEAATEYWIAYSLPPARAALAAVDWTPDELDVYCARCGASLPPMPQRPGPPLPRAAEAPPRCPACLSAPALADQVIRLGPYAGPLREWILDVKYRRRWEEMAELLGGLLGERLLEARVLAPGGGATTASDGLIVVVPMPMPRARRLARGIDHARAIARGVGRTIGAPVAPVLARANGPPQVTLSRTLRARSGGRGLRAARRLFAWTGLVAGTGLTGRQVVLVDDVATTGATVRAAARLLRRMGASRVVAAVVAVADDAARRHRLSADGAASVQPAETPAARAPWTRRKP